MVVKDKNGVEIKHGNSIICTIDDIPIQDAKAAVKNGNLYICQNKKSGYKIGDTFEYKYSWAFDRHVKNLEVIGLDYEIF